MTSLHPARRGISISVKLVIATSVVVALAVGTAALFAHGALTELTESQIAARRDAGERAIARESELVVQKVATAVALPLANTAYSDIRPVLEAAIAEDRASKDNRVQWLVVTDQLGTIVERAGRTPDSAALADLERLVAAGQTANAVARAPITATEWVYGADIELAGSAVGTLRIGVSTAGLARELGASLAAAAELAQAARRRALLVAAAVLAFGIVLAGLQGLQLARPIRALTAQAARIAAGDFTTRVGGARRDELGVLAHSFDVMSDEIVRLLIEQRAKASLEKEMSLARSVQQAMLPPDTLDHHGALKVVGYCMPASSCGGDWWTYHKLAHGRLLLVIGDATGHGIHSAMIAATARGAVEALGAVDQRLLTPDQVLRAIDAAIRQIGDHNVLMTAFAAVFDSITGIVHYANAGQNFPYVVKLGHGRVLGPASVVVASGNPLGDRQIAPAIQRGSRTLAAGDVFVCFTDGVVERANPEGVMFGDRRLCRALVGEPLADGAALVGLRDRLVATLEHHAAGAIAQDDVTFVLCQFDPASVELPASRDGDGQPSRGAA